MINVSPPRRCEILSAVQHPDLPARRPHAQGEGARPHPRHDLLGRRGVTGRDVGDLPAQQIVPVQYLFPRVCQFLFRALPPEISPPLERVALFDGTQRDHSAARIASPEGCSRRCRGRPTAASPPRLSRDSALLFDHAVCPIAPRLSGGAQSKITVDDLGSHGSPPSSNQPNIVRRRPPCTNVPDCSVAHSC